ncbi:MAG: redoxin domain-containing protein [Caldiserica bacterium]|nr:redoxin domain-containing protein [Caldisericota bacterium]
MKASGLIIGLFFPFLILFSSGKPRKPLPGGQVVEILTHRYSQISTYQGIWEISQITRMGDVQVIQREKEWIMLEKPDKLFILTKNSSQNRALICNGGRAWIYNYAKGEYAELQAGMEESVRKLVSSTFASFLMKFLFFSEEGFLEELKERGQVVEGEQFYSLNAFVDKELKMEIKVDKGDISLKEVSLSWERNGYGFQLIGKFSQVQLNQKIPARSFLFEPTPEMKKIKAEDMGGKASWRGKVARNFSLKTLKGEMVSLEDFRGKVVIIDFWALFCGPCKKEIPQLEKIYRDFKSSDLVVLGITAPVMQEDEEKEVREYLENTGITFPVLWDKDSEVFSAYRVEAIPRTLLVDREGVVREDLTGLQAEGKIRMLLYLLGIRR